MRLIISVLLFIIAYLLVAILAPIGMIFTILFFPSQVSKYFFNTAISLDQLGNVTCKFLLDLVMIIKKSIYKFGSPDETVSSVLGKNYMSSTLTKFGKRISFILNVIDKNHVIKAIEKDE